MAFLVNTGVKVTSQIQPVVWFTSLMRVNSLGKSRSPFDPPEHPGGRCSWSQSLCFVWKLLPEVVLAAPSVRNALLLPLTAQALFYPLWLSFSAISSRRPAQAPRRHLHGSGKLEMLHPFSGRKPCMFPPQGLCLREPWHTLVGGPQRLAPQRHLSSWPKLCGHLSSKWWFSD